MCFKVLVNTCSICFKLSARLGFKLNVKCGFVYLSRILNDSTGSSSALSRGVFVGGTGLNCRLICSSRSKAQRNLQEPNIQYTTETDIVHPKWTYLSVLYMWFSLDCETRPLPTFRAGVVGALCLRFRLRSTMVLRSTWSLNSFYGCFIFISRSHFELKIYPYIISFINMKQHLLACSEMNQEHTDFISSMIVMIIEFWASIAVKLKNIYRRILKSSKAKYLKTVRFEAENVGT